MGFWDGCEPGGCHGPCPCLQGVRGASCRCICDGSGSPSHLSEMALWDGNGASTGSLLHSVALSGVGGSPVSGFEDLLTGGKEEAIRERHQRPGLPLRAGLPFPQVPPC